MASEMMWRKLSDAEREKIKKDSKELILAFGDTLEKLPKVPEAVVEREEFERNEGNGNEKDREFRELIFKNAPKKNSECIIAEKGKWVE
ncbi:hypothetical protein J4463_03795 [Candidatus Pacearchaeota archaeon]|nr:hypothetical protein [Candidatus Pacearchaeota archaeon]